MHIRRSREKTKTDELRIGDDRSKLTGRRRAKDHVGARGSFLRSILAHEMSHALRHNALVSHVRAGLAVDLR